MVEPITISIAAAGTALGSVTVGLTSILAILKILQKIDNSFYLVDKIKAKLNKIKETRRSKREKQNAVNELIEKMPDIANRLDRLNSVIPNNDERNNDDDDDNEDEINISAHASSNDNSYGIYPSPVGVDPNSNIQRQALASVDVKVRQPTLKSSAMMWK